MVVKPFVFRAFQRAEVAPRHELSALPGQRSPTDFSEEPKFSRAANTHGKFKKHLWGILNAVVLDANNGHTESTNSKIKMIKVRSRGIQNKELFKAAIYFHLGGLDLYPAGVR